MDRNDEIKLFLNHIASSLLDIVYSIFIHFFEVLQNTILYLYKKGSYKFWEVPSLYYVDLSLSRSWRKIVYTHNNFRNNWTLANRHNAPAFLVKYEGILNIGFYFHTCIAENCAELMWVISRFGSRTVNTPFGRPSWTELLVIGRARSRSKSSWIAACPKLHTSMSGILWDLWINSHKSNFVMAMAWIVNLFCVLTLLEF